MTSGVREVKYIGKTADVRTISTKEWAAIRVTGQDTVTWDKTNDFTLSGDRFVDDAIAYFHMDDEFEVIVEGSTA